jgi:two-component system NtrC family sensor kinase
MDGAGIETGQDGKAVPAVAQRLRAAPRAPSRRLAGLRLVAVLLPLAALGAMGALSWQAVRNEAIARVGRAADMLHEHALRALEAQEIAIAAVEQRIEGMSWPAIRASAEVHAFLSALDAVTPAAGGVGLVDPDGRLALSSTAPFPTPDIDLAGRDYVAAHPPGVGGREAPFIGQVVRARPSGAVIVPMARPRRRADGLGDGGVISATLWPAYFQAFYASVRETPEDAFRLFRLDGALLAAVPPPSPAEGAVLAPSAAGMLRALHQRPALNLVGASPIDGVPRIVAVRRLMGQDLAVSYGLPLEAVRKEWVTRMLGPLAAALLAIMLLGALTLQAERALRARELAEARSRAAERQATLGLLAGGLAHDFGNITQSVLAAAMLLGRHAEDPARVRQIAEHLRRHATRATALSRRMLDTTRRSGAAAATDDGPLDVSEALRELAALLDATLGAGLRVRAEVEAGLRAPPTLDRAGLETALINLAANARDAMPGGGEIRILADRVTMAPPLSTRLALPAGAYLRIALRDAGLGMDAATLARLGEPFFTTKPEGAGTGLGLAMVAAFLRSANGAFTAESEPGRGSTITLYLPAEAPVSAA